MVIVVTILLLTADISKFGVITCSMRELQIMYVLERALLAVLQKLPSTTKTLSLWQQKIQLYFFWQLLTSGGV